MTNPSCLIELKEILPKTTWPQVFLALRQDELIWQGLQNPDFRELAISKFGNHPEKWNPAQLAILALRNDLEIKDLQKTPLSELDPELRLRAIQTYEEHSKGSPPKMTLATAGLLSLALQEHFRLTNSWEKIPQSEHWQTPFACLYGLIEQSNTLLKSLPAPLAIHTILANPLSPEEQTNIFSSVLVSLPNHRQLAFIRSLAINRPNLAGSIAQKLWSGMEDQNHPDPNKLTDTLPAFRRIQKLREAIKVAIIKAEVQIAKGDGDQGSTSLQAAWETTRQLESLLAAQAAIVAVSNGNIEEATTHWETAQKPLEIPVDQTADLAFRLTQNDHFEDAKPLFDKIGSDSHPAALLALANAAYQQGKEKEAEEAALKAAKDPQRLNFNQQYVLAKLLFDLRLPTEAVYIIEIARLSPSPKAEQILLSAQAYTAIGAYPQAIQAIHLATALHPDQVDIQRSYARIHEYANQLPAALEARKEIIETQSDPLIADFQALAECALKLNQLQLAEDACHSILEIDPKDGLAYALLGEVYSLMGKSVEAEQHLQESIKFTPNQALPWLILARFHNRAGNLHESSETLRKGAHASPETAEIHLLLGEDYLLAGAPSQALVSLRKANHLAKSYPPIESFYIQSQIAQPLAKTLFELGHAEEALKTIQAIQPLPENQADTLHLQAKILIFLDRAEQAIPLLAKALLANPSDTAINLDYARAQLEAKNDPSKAINALLALLENDPENAEALAWLAEALKANGDTANALAAYRKALATRLSEDPYWHPKLVIGLAQSALSLGQPEIALATLQQSWQTSPQNLLKITQTLAIAYDAAHLKDKALRTAHAARDMDPLSVETLIWFAKFTCELQAYDEAANALNNAIELEPSRADLRLQLGNIHQKTGNSPEAHRVFQSIINLDQASPRELRAAAKSLIKMNYPEDAVDCLKNAVGRCQEGPQKNICPNLFLELIEVYSDLGMHVEALAAADDILEKQVKNDPALIGQRAILLNRLGRSEEAFAAIDQALSEETDSNPLYLAAAQIHYATGDLPKALEHAQMAIQTHPRDDDGESLLTTLALAADIADAGLRSQITTDIMSYDLGQAKTAHNLEYTCLRSELALKADEEIDAAQALTSALTAASDHPRVLALQARLAARNGDGRNAQQILQNSLKTWGELPTCEMSPAGILGISEALLELRQWSTAIYLLQEAAEKFHQEPRAHLRLARGLVLRAEHQKLCETLEVTGHAPGSSALAEYSYQIFEQAILAAAQTSEGSKKGTQQAQITHWRIRGQAAFRPSGEHTRALGEIPHTSESKAALLAALRNSRDKQQSKKIALDNFESALQSLATDFGSSLILMVQIALALSKQKPKIAAQAAQSALDASIRQKLLSQPFFYATQAYVAEQTGDFEAAFAALEIALSQWPDETRWHVWAAELQKSLTEPDTEIAIKHLSQATNLEPKNGAHHLKLGKVYLETGDPASAIPTLEQAACLLPKRSEPRMELARAYQATGDIAQIFHNAERAAELDPRNIDPHILLAETAIEINNPEKAIEFCRSAFEINSEYPQALILHARALSMIGQPTEALQSFDQALTRTPKSVSLMLEHAQLTQQAMGSQNAIKELQDLTIEYPEDPRVLASLAKALINNDQPDPAIEAAQKALQANQGILDCTQESHLLETLGRLMRRNGQLDHAIHYLSEAIQCNPESIGAYLELGRVYQDRRQYAQALDVFQQAIALAPGNAHAYYQAGQMLKATKNYAAAEEMLQNAAKLAPDDLAIRRQLGGLVALNLVHNRKDNSEIYVE